MFIAYVGGEIENDLYAFDFFLDHLWVLFPDVVMVLASEIAVDVVKHAFITKFNDISADVSSLLISVGAVYSKGHITFSFKVKICLIKLRRDLSVIQQKQPHTKELTLLSLNCQTNAQKLFNHCWYRNSVRLVSVCVAREQI